MVSTLAFPSIYVLTAHLTTEELGRLQSQIPFLEHDAKKAGIILGKLSRKERAQFELRRLGIATEETVGKLTRTAPTSKRHSSPSPHISECHVFALKRRRKSGDSFSPAGIPAVSSSKEGDTSRRGHSARQDEKSALEGGSPPDSHASPTVKVVRLAWFDNSIACGAVLPLEDYILYEGRIAKPETRPSGRMTSSLPNTVPGGPRSVASKESLLGSPSLKTYSQHGSSSRRTVGQTSARPPTLTRKTTSENDESTEIPQIPACLHTTYSCERSTPLHPPNESFIDILKNIRKIRKLTGDEIGVRAYSTSIASLAAYPHVISVPAEVSHLPGCGPKIAELFREFSATGGHVHEADDAETDPKLTVLRLFCDIWGVAEATARAFYNRGWRDLDDIVEFGWAELTRVQQIGVKYYNELLLTMTRAQVEAIADTVLEHANRVFPGFQMVIAGGYRRGKEMSGDVDVILSHPDEEATRLVIGALVLALERAGCITHTLTFSTANSERAQEPVSWKGNAPRHTLIKSADAGSSGGGGFDTLDKALVVWQEPTEEEKTKHGRMATEGDLGTIEMAKSGEEHGHDKSKPNLSPHRRVDIIVSPWKTVGCAVLGWSGGTTFQRDLRRYCKRVLGLRFDSSGVRSRTDGSWVDLEDFARDPAPDMLTAERRVFTALGLEWRPPTERCTG